MPTQSAERRPRAFLELVVTPESIPEFTIPRRGSSSSSRRGSLGPCCCPPPGPGLGEEQEPGTRLAMSLPHLRRVTTPYGFLALGESPCVRRKESLFLGGPEEGGWGAVRDPRGTPCPRGTPGRLAPGLSCASLPSPEPPAPACAGKPRRALSWDLGVPGGKARLQRLLRKHLSRAHRKRRARGNQGEQELPA